MMDISALSLYPNTRYHYITTGNNLACHIDLIKSAPELGISIKTTGVDPHRDCIRLLQIASPQNPTLVIDLFKVPQADWNPLIKLMQGSALKVGHGLKLEKKFLEAAGIGFCEPYFDTELAHRLLLAGRKKRSDLQSVIAQYFKYYLDTTQKKSDFSRKLNYEQIQYASAAAAAPLKLKPVLENQLKESVENQWELAQTIEFPCIAVTANLERLGVRFDSQQWETTEQQFKISRDKAWKVVRQIRRVDNNQMSFMPNVTEVVNPNSQQQLLPALRALGIEVNSTNEKTLLPYAKDFPVVKALLDYRRFNKLTDPLNQNFRQWIHPVTQRIHGSWFQIGTRTGRLTCKNPALQAIPRNPLIRKCFVARPNYKIIKADYSQIELRILARVCDDKPLIRAFQEHQDVHTLTAAAVLNKPVEQITEEERQVGKVINFGIIYGMGAKRLQATLKNDSNYLISINEAIAFIHAFYSRHPAIKDWQDELRHQVYRQKHYNGCTLAGRVRHWEWEDKPPINEIINYPIQGLNADIFKLAAVNFTRAEKHQGLHGEIILVVHDEIVLECPELEAEKVERLLNQSMIQAANQWLSPVPIIVVSKIGDSWGESTLAA